MCSKNPTENEFLHHEISFYFFAGAAALSIPGIICDFGSILAVAFTEFFGIGDFF